jgi:hypothetical protein
LPKQFRTKEDREERKKKLKEMNAWASTLPPIFESLADQIVYELL